MADVELADSLYDSSLEVVGTQSPGADPYKIRVASSLQTQIADHETRLDAIEGGGDFGNVDGPGSSTDNAVARFDGTSGQLLQNSVVTIADSSGNMAGVGTLNTRTIANWVDGPGSATSGNIAVFNGTTGKLIQNGTKTEADLVTGPASSTDNAIARFDGTTGKVVQNSAVTVADTTGSIDNTSGSGTMTSTRFIGPATALRSATTSVDVVAATAPSTGQVLTATDSTHATWQTPATVTASGSPSELHYPPTSPDARDDEFTSTTLDSAWVMYGSGGTALTAPSKTAMLYTAPGSGLSRYQAHTDRRNSWLNTQVDTQMHMLKLVTLGTNDFAWTRISAQQDTTSGGNTIELLLTVMAATSGHPDINNRIWVGISISNGVAAFAYASRIIAGVQTNIPSSEASTLVSEARGGGHAYEYFGIDKIGTRYRFYAAAKGYRRQWTDGTAISFTPAYIGWTMRPGTIDPTIFGVDFIRFNTGGFLASPL